MKPAALYAGCLWASSVGGPVPQAGADGDRITGAALMSFVPGGRRSRPPKKLARRLGDAVTVRLPLRMQYYLASEPLRAALLWLALHQERDPAYRDWRYDPLNCTDTSVVGWRVLSIHTGRR